MDQDEHRYVKKEVTNIVVVITILVVILIALFVSESRTSFLTNLLSRFIR